MKPFLFILFLSSSYIAIAQVDSAMYGYIDSVTYKPAEISPSYPGGTSQWRRYLEKTMKYPGKAMDKNISGTVVVEFTVDTQGHTSDYKIFHSIYPSLDKEALRLVENSKLWSPAIQNGKQVIYRTRTDIEFRLD